MCITKSLSNRLCKGGGILPSQERGDAKIPRLSPQMRSQQGAAEGRAARGRVDPRRLQYLPPLLLGRGGEPTMELSAATIEERHCHTRFSEGNQVHTYMHARIKFHAYSDVKVYTETVSLMKVKDYQSFKLYPGNEGSKHHRQSTGACVRLAPATTSQDFRVASFF
jgi:hypothetical protein